MPTPTPIALGGGLTALLALLILIAAVILSPLFWLAAAITPCLDLECLEGSP